MKLVDILRKKMVGEIFTSEEIDLIMEENKYLPVEMDDDTETFKYSNGKSQLWVKYIRENTEYLIENITRSNKKTGSTKVRAFRTFEEIKGMMDYFRNNEKYDEFLIFMLGLFLARRIGDTLSLKWSDFFYANGRKKENLKTLIEEKTEKTVDISITNIAWQYIDWYCNRTGINPIEVFNKDIFMKFKNELSDHYTDEEYGKIIERQESSYRYEFKNAADYNGIENVSTHSTRKSFGRIAHEINKYDPDCLPTLQTIFGHDSVETTKIYIDVIPEKAEKMFNDVAQRLYDIDNGINPVIDNIPVVALKTNDLRDILKIAYMNGKEYDGQLSDIEIMNRLISLVEERRIS